MVNAVLKIRYIFPLLLFSTSFAHSQEIEETLISQVYTANENSPVTYQNIDKEDFQSIGLKEPSLFLQETPSILAYSDSGSYQGYSYFRLRGIDQTRINMTLDGIPLNEPEDQGAYFSNYPGILASLEKIQIQRGVGTSQNGTASYAGSVQLYSIDHQQPGKSEINLDYGSFDSVSGSVQYLSGLNQGKSIYINLSGVDTNGYKDNSANQSSSLFISGVKEDESGKWRLLGFSGKQKNQLAWVAVEQDVIKKNPKANVNTPDEIDSYQQSLISLAREQLLSDKIQLEVRAYYNYLDGSYDFDFNNFIGLEPNGEIYNYAVSSDFYGALVNLYYKGDAFDFAAGLHANQYQRQHTGSDKFLGELYSNKGYKDSYAAFVKYNYYVNAWTFFTDVQYRYTDFDYKGSVDFEKMEWDFTNTRVGLSYQFSDGVLAYYSLGKTGREPTRTDLFGGMDNLELNEQGNPALYIVDPERVVNQELGLRYQSDDIHWNANFFHMNFDTEITLAGGFGPNGLLLNQNVDKSIRQGIEASMDWNITSSLYWRNWVSYTHARIKDQGQSFHPVMTPQWIAFTALEYQKENFSMGVDYRYQASAYIDLANTSRVDAYQLINIFGLYKHRNIEYKLSINNLLDKNYLASGAINANGMPAYFVGMPINFTLGIKATFE
jgi:iron complex outermembrane receptor protein